MHAILFSLLLSLQVNNLQLDTNRKLLLLAAPNEPLVGQQLQLLQQDSAGLEERDILVQVVDPDDRLYREYKIAAGIPFTVILIGKDGGEKYRSAKPVTSAHLFALIDAMPMRKAEIKMKKQTRK